MSLTIEQVAPHRLIPVVTCESAARAAPLAEALKAGGISCAEVTFRTPDALASLRAMAGVADFIVGAGTVVRPDQADAAADAGARFVVSPGLSSDVVSRCRELDLAILPGVATASEVMRALELGVNVLKFFPAESSGGVAAIAALSGPFADVRFVPTGGITLTNAHDYLRLPNVAAIGGSWLTPIRLQADDAFEGIAALAAEALAVVGTTGVAP